MSIKLHFSNLIFFCQMLSLFNQINLRIFIKNSFLWLLFQSILWVMLGIVLLVNNFLGFLK